jgi:hypothetical protein
MEDVTAQLKSIEKHSGGTNRIREQLTVPKATSSSKESQNHKYNIGQANLVTTEFPIILQDKPTSPTSLKYSEGTWCDSGKLTLEKKPTLSLTISLRAIVGYHLERGPVIETMLFHTPENKE